MRIRQPSRDVKQHTLYKWNIIENPSNIGVAGDLLQERSEQDGIMRIGYHNIHGSEIDSGLEIAEELEAIVEIGADIQGMSEMNKPWTKSTQIRYQLQLDSLFKSTKIMYATAETEPSDPYHPGGNMLLLTGMAARRGRASGRDKWGRSCWHTMIGSRDEEFIIISAYRVCQTKADNPGPFTAFTQQYLAMREEEIINLNPRQRILPDMLQLIKEKRAEGYRPILMMDTNGDYNHSTKPNIELCAFLQEACLVLIWRADCRNQN